MWAWLEYWPKITGGIAGTGAVGTLYVSLGGPYPVLNTYVEDKVAEVRRELTSLRSPLRSVQINQIEGQISAKEAEQDTLLADKAKMAIDLPKTQDATARNIIEQRLREIDARLKRVAKDIQKLEADVAMLRSTGGNAPVQ